MRSGWADDLFGTEEPHPDAEGRPRAQARLATALETGSAAAARMRGATGVIVRPVRVPMQPATPAA